MIENQSNREFRKIPSLDFLYEVNDNGTVIRNVKSKRHLKLFLKSHNSSTQYWCTQVNIKKHIRKVFVHRVVAECWLGQRPIGLECDHIDRNSLNNDYHNLRYVTKSEQNRNRDMTKAMPKLLANLAIKNKGIILPVRLIRADFSKDFPSARQACKYLVSIYPDTSEKCFLDKFHYRRHHIYDYDVKYLNAETGRSDQCTVGKEQSTLLVYLVGDVRKRFNNAKQAEVKDRVKHLKLSSNQYASKAKEVKQ